MFQLIKKGESDKSGSDVSRYAERAISEERQRRQTGIRGRDRRRGVDLIGRTKPETNRMETN